MDEMFDAIILDCNNAVRNLAGGNYIAFCSMMAQVVQRVTNARQIVAETIDNKNKQIEELKTINNRLAEKDGAE